MRRNWKRLALVVCAAALCISLLGMTAVAAEPATAQIPVRVALTGTQPEQAETFTVELTAEDDGAPMPAGAADGKFLLALTAESSKKLEISFHELGVYHYTVRQLPGSNADCYQDESIYHITIQVINNEAYDGYGLVVAVRRNDEAEKRTEILFENRYADPTAVSLHAYKTLDGETPKDGAFTFELADEAGKKQTVTNKGKDVTFAAISYDAAGEYTYTIREIPGKVTGIQYDPAVYTAKVTVDKDEEGNYRAKVVYYQGEKQLESAPLFQNTAKPITVQMQAQKTLDGETPVTGVFSFELRDAAGKKVQTVTNADEAVAFDAIAYEAPGVYTYTLREIPGKNKGIVYDEAVFTAQVTVSKDKNGALQADVKYLLQEQALDDVPVFQNKAKPVSGDIHAYKTLDGKKPKNGAFSFELLDSEGKVVQTVTNKGKNVEFQEISCDKEGTYTYTIREIPGNDEEIIYDSAVYTANVEVKRQEDGTLRAVTTYAKAEKALEEAPTFRNKTKAPTPQTGDSFNLPLVVTVMAVCLAAVVVLLLAMRKRKKA